MGAVKAKFGRIDALLNIAGGFQWATVEDGEAESWDRMVALNLKTALNASKAALPYLLRERRGPHRQCRRAIRPSRGVRNWPLRRQQIGGAPADRKPR